MNHLSLKRLIGYYTLQCAGGGDGGGGDGPPPADSSASFSVADFSGLAGFAADATMGVAPEGSAVAAEAAPVAAPVSAPPPTSSPTQSQMNAFDTAIGLLSSGGISGNDAVNAANALNGELSATPVVNQATQQNGLGQVGKNVATMGVNGLLGALSGGLATVANTGLAVTGNQTLGGQMVDAMTTAPNSGVSTGSIGAQGSANDPGFEGSMGTGEGSGPTDANGGPGVTADLSGGLLGSAPTPVTESPATVQHAVDYSLFGKLGTGAWSSAAKKLAAKRKWVTA